MLVIAPIHAKNAPLFEQFAKLFEKIGPNANHDFVVLACPTVLEEGQIFGERISRLFREVQVTVAENEVHDLMRGRNQMFRQAAEIAAAKNLPWIWFEDAYPSQRGWLDYIETEYKENVALPFLGCLEPAYEKARDNEGRFIEGQFAEKGQFMRFGVYPANFNTTSTLLRFLGDIPFEHYLRGEVVSQARQSKSMATVWASVDFERNSSEYVEGKQSPAYESAIRKDAKKAVNDRDVAIVHGCRDGSLGFVFLRKTYMSPDDQVMDRRRRDEEKQLEESNRLREGIETLTGERDELQEEVERLQAVNAELEDRLQSQPGEAEVDQEHEEEIAKKDMVISEYKGEIQRLEKELGAIVKERTALRSRITKLENKLA